MAAAQQEGISQSVFPPEREEKKLEYVFVSDCSLDCDDNDDVFPSPPRVFQSNYDSEEEVDQGFREMTEQELVDYNKQLEESMGFDVEVADNIVGCGVLKPLRHFKKISYILEDLTLCSESAIKYYNTHHGTTFKLVEVLKANAELCCFMYYITFMAMDVGQPPRLSKLSCILEFIRSR